MCAETLGGLYVLGGNMSKEESHEEIQKYFILFEAFVYLAKRMLASMYTKTFALAAFIFITGFVSSAHAATIAPSVISDAQTWSIENSPYIISTKLTIASGGSLTIDPGVVVKLDAQGSIDVAGSLSAHGTSAAGVVFTNLSDASYGGDTSGLAIVVPPGTRATNQIVAEQGSIVSLSFTQLSYNGHVGGGGDFIIYSPLVYNNGGSILIADSLITNGSGDAVQNLSGSLSFIRSTVADMHWSSSRQLYASIKQYGGTTAISNSTLMSKGFIMSGGDLTLTKTDTSSGVIYGASVFHDGGGNTGSIVLDWQNQIDADNILPAAPFVNFLDSFSIPAGRTFTITPGAILKANSAIEVYGTLSTGAGTAPAIITSVADDSAGGDTDHSTVSPAPDDWGGIVLENGSSVTLSHADIRYGGYAYDYYSLLPCGESDAELLACTGQIINLGGTLDVSDSVFSHPLSNHLFQDAGTSTFTRARFLGSTAARVRGGTLSLHQSSIAPLGGAGLLNEDASSVSVENNWWGDASGPKHVLLNPSGKGAVVSGPASITPWLDHDPFAATTTAPAGSSNILFLPGIEGSRLYQKVLGLEIRHWEPLPLNFQFNAKSLYLNSLGQSINSIYTKKDGVISHVDEPLSNVDVYRTFFNELITIKASGGIKDYLAFPYDWRMSPIDVVEKGTQYDDGIHFAYDSLARLASTSITGKVTIVAHSNGGLVAKALMNKLVTQGKANLVDKIILVDVPQVGTPKAIDSMLHGDTSGLPGFLLSKKNARGLTKNMLDAYDLLPSQSYFDHVSTPVIDLANAPILRASSGVSSSSIASEPIFTKFITGSSGRAAPAFDDIESPEVLSPQLLASSTSLHSSLDNWVPPVGVKVIQIAGSGIDTPATVIYTETKQSSCSLINISCTSDTVLRHALNMTSDGDGTVVAASESINNTWPTYYIDLRSANLSAGKNWSHGDVTESEPFQSLFKMLISSSSPTIVPKNVLTSLPASALKGNRLRLRILSPVSLEAYDSQGRHTGKVSTTSNDSDIQYVDEQIPNSYYEEYGEGKYLGLPADVKNTIKLQGLDTGTFTFEITSDNGGVAGGAVSYPNIPVTASTTAELVVQGSNVSGASLSLDTNGDGKTDTFLASSTQSLSPPIYVRLIKDAVLLMGMGTTSTNQLVAKFSNVEHLILKESKWNDTDDDNDKDEIKKDEHIEARIIRKLDKIDAWLSRQFSKSEKEAKDRKKYIKNLNQITAEQTGAIINMTDHLKDLVQK
jgi:pimeloyl-ACP methyl ester carboxylesterase